MPRGGRRSGRTGKAYSNRTDLNARTMLNAVPPSNQYGQGVATERALSAVPMKNPAAPSPAGAAQPGPSAPPLPQPGSLGFLDDSARPGEPVQHGLVNGPGAGPEVLGGMDDPTIDELRAAYMLVPNEYLRELIELLDEDE